MFSRGRVAKVKAKAKLAPPEGEEVKRGSGGNPKKGDRSLSV